MANNPHTWKRLFSTPKLQVLDFMLQNSDLELNDTEIAAKVNGVKRSAVNIALRELAQMGLVRRTPRGNMVFNRLIDSAFIRTLKIASNLMMVQKFVEQIRDKSTRIILFGSRAAGENTSDSDIDLLVVSDDKESIQKNARGSKIENRIQLVTKSQHEWLSLASDDKVFYETVKKGIVIWERE